MDFRDNEWLEQMNRMSEEILANTLIKCKWCGWKGSVRDAPELNDQGWRLCPQCERYSGLEGGR